MNATKSLLTAACAIAAILPVDHLAADFVVGTPENLGPAINSVGYDHAPRLSEDGLCLYLQRETGVWMSTRATKDDPWGPAVHVGSLQDDIRTLLRPFKVMPGFTTADGLEIYFGWEADLWMMTRETMDADWEPRVNLGPVVNSPTDEIFPTVSANGLELYFSGYGSEEATVRPGGYGAADLWVTKRATGNDPWGVPVNLGPVVNSAKQDARAFLSADGLVLLFDSRRPGRYGATDLWMTKRATLSDPWGTPQNLGPLVNTSAMEECVSVSADGSTLYWDSDRSGGYGSNDIWQAAIIPIVDFNADGKVDLVDLVMLIDNWGTNKTLCDIGPMPWGDGKVDIEDLKVFMTYFEKENPPRANAGK